MRKLVIGDIHGRYKELKKVLEKANFDFKEDLLISLGDLVDRGNYPVETIHFLMEIPNLISIRGNHDACLQIYLERKCFDFSQHLLQGNHGSLITCDEINLLSENENEQILNFLKKQKDYWLDDSDNLFVHGGFNIKYKLEQQIGDEFYWNRELFQYCLSSQNEKTPIKTLDKIQEIFIGHTPTIFYSKKNSGKVFVREGNPITTPIHVRNLWNLDTGAGYSNGYLTIMDIETKEFWQQKIENV